jgi:hypothetical protein
VVLLRGTDAGATRRDHTDRVVRCAFVERIGFPTVSAVDDAHEWVSFEDPDEERTWVLDLTFLTSPWTCIFGAGCQGVLTAPAPELVQGCCSYGAHLADKKDLRRVEKAATKLTRAQFQFFDRAKQLGVARLHQGEWKTRLVDGACIFLNRPGFSGGAGCALHLAALEAGMPPLQMKPEVCWQLPIRREDFEQEDGHVTSTVTQWDRRHWGPAGEEFAWWCTEAPEAFVGREPVYKSNAAELKELLGPTVYEMLVEHLATRTGERAVLPHPVVRRHEVRSASSSSSGSSTS